MSQLDERYPLLVALFAELPKRRWALEVRRGDYRAIPMRIHPGFIALCCHISVWPQRKQGGARDSQSSAGLISS
jgi:hypothetical protein